MVPGDTRASHSLSLLQPVHKLLQLPRKVTSDHSELAGSQQSRSQLFDTISAGEFLSLKEIVHSCQKESIEHNSTQGQQLRRYGGGR